MILNEGKESTFHITGSDYYELLDYLFVSPFFANKMSCFQVLKNSILDSDHSPIQAEFNLLNSVKKKLELEVILYNYKKADWTKLKQDFEEIKEEEFLNLDAVTHSNKFNDYVIKKIDENIPKITYSHKSNYTYLVRLLN